MHIFARVSVLAIALEIKLAHDPVLIIRKEIVDNLVIVLNAVRHDLLLISKGIIWQIHNVVLARLQGLWVIVVEIFFIVCLIIKLISNILNQPTYLLLQHWVCLCHLTEEVLHS